MQIQTEFIDIPAAGKPMRALVARPVGNDELSYPIRYPGIVCFADIFQLSAAQQRLCARLAGHGYVVVAHEFFHRREPAGTVFASDDAGRGRAMDNQKATALAEYDEDGRAVIAYLQQHPQVKTGQLGATGFCIGGHLAFRAALQPEIKATACFYPTWLHNGQLGLGQQADSLQRAGEIKGELLIHFGKQDPLIPTEGRALIEAALQTAGVRYQADLYEAGHAFARDDRDTYDPACADLAISRTVQFWQRTFALA